MRFYFSFIVLLLAFFSCEKNADNAANSCAYIGGEIINPSTNYVVLSKNQSILDTVKLNGVNRFIYKIDSLQPGLYTFKHGLESQIVLLEPKDSVFFRLNTLDFDESLVFTGKGDKKNNYLIEDFLFHEKEEKDIVRLSQLPPLEYEKKIDSIKAIKDTNLERFISKYEPSPLFVQIIEANNRYSYYSNKEVYPFAHHGRNKAKNLKGLPADFYNYRKTINYNDTVFSDYPNYQTFLKHNLSNLALKVHKNHDPGKSREAHAFCYNYGRLKLVDSLVTNSLIKDDLLYHFTLKYLSKSDNEENNKKILNFYRAKSSNASEKERMSRYAQSIHRLKNGSTLPTVNLVDYNNNALTLNSVIKELTVITFWSNVYYEHFKDSHYKIKELKIKYPDVNFISININDFGIAKAKKILDTFNFNHAEEYQFENSEVASEKLIIYPITKVIIVDKDKKIIDSNSNIFSYKFEDNLLGLINR
ncbi:hypothetical protein Q4566_14925 [Tamlana sp. 2_MG-2023]|uniref:TlpA family protein disulfide reductase n=1 Tax=unclassified Tamlana TaxID=2614803 RepID=UPI0026E299B0|nr:MULTISPECIES: hypothetical protein [unclassified Tamlana]MDO6761503.1 hypothetical protein [Tamlana sp. 2_MG-2023]MDO6792403.1 hypothetical protein [Tamlana sp. 1_MG-2023]